eukprot:gene32938-44062_t
MADNFTDNPVAGFKTFRDSHDGKPGSDPRLAQLGLSTRKLDGLREDVLTGALPQVSWIVAPAAASEHPGPSSPVQGADYTAQVIEALTADPAVWARTVLFIMFDENDGFFDHVPPPAPPSADGGGSTVDTTGEYHLETTASEAATERPELMGRPYGLGPRVPMYVVSPWSRGGWVSSEVFDHTSVIRFMETRFGVESAAGGTHAGGHEAHSVTDDAAQIGRLVRRAHQTIDAHRHGLPVAGALLSAAFRQSVETGFDQRLEA